MAVSASYVDHYLSSLETLPSDLERNFALMRELDTKVQEQLDKVYYNDTREDLYDRFKNSHSLTDEERNSHSLTDEERRQLMLQIQKVCKYKIQIQIQNII